MHESILHIYIFLLVIFKKNFTFFFVCVCPWVCMRTRVRPRCVLVVSVCSGQFDSLRPPRGPGHGTEIVRRGSYHLLSHLAIPTSFSKAALSLLF